MMSVLPWISIERNSYWSWSLSKISIKCHNEPDLFPSCKPTNIFMGIYDGQTYYLKTRVYIWTMICVVLMGYGIFPIFLSLKYGSFSLLMELPSGGIICCF